MNRRFFFIVLANNCANTLCISKLVEGAMEEKIHSKPYESLCEDAQSGFYNYSSSCVSVSGSSTLTVTASTR